MFSGSPFLKTMLGLGISHAFLGLVLGQSDGQNNIVVRSEPSKYANMTQRNELVARDDVVGVCYHNYNCDGTPSQIHGITNGGFNVPDCESIIMLYDGVEVCSQKGCIGTCNTAAFKAHKCKHMEGLSISCVVLGGHDAERRDIDQGVAPAE